MKLYGFYHVAAINNYIELVTEQLLNIKQSGLINKTDILFIGLIGSSKSKINIIEILNDLEIVNYEIKLWGENLTMYEFPTINLIYKLSNEIDFYCYYLHTKGISITKENSSIHNSNYELVRKSVDSWRNFMEYFIINKYEVCIKNLRDYDVIGASLRTKPVTHIPGNFWWSKSEHIKKLKQLISNDRYDAEWWICNNKSKILAMTDYNVSYINPVSEVYKKIII